MAEKNQIAAITEIGFKHAGTCCGISGQLKFDLFPDFKDDQGIKHILYTFVLGTEVKYVGKSVRSLSKRMQNYKTPGASQSTNVKVRRKILGLGESNIVDIYVFPDLGLLGFGKFHLSIAAGLEDSLINELKPAWNHGKKLIEASQMEVPVQ